MKRFQITEAEYEAIRAKEAKTKDKNISRRLRVLMLRYEGKKTDEIAKMLNLNKGKMNARFTGALDRSARFWENGSQEPNGRFCRSAPSDPDRITEDRYLQKEFHRAVESVKTSLARRMMLSAPFFALSAPVGLTLTIILEVNAKSPRRSARTCFDPLQYNHTLSRTLLKLV